jgi:LCP family protein required for cell wall assembly
MAEGQHRAPNRSARTGRSASRTLANEQRLVALGDAIDQHNGVVKADRGLITVATRWVSEHRKILQRSGLAMVVLVAALAGGGYLYFQHVFNSITKFTAGSELPTIDGQPFNVLSIGSDSRVGLTGAVAAQTGATAGSAAGQRSDVIKIMHIDPGKGTIDVISIPRDTLVQLLPPAQALFQTPFGKINSTFFSGPDLLVQTIQKTFGIPINHVIVVGFAGVMNSAVALGGVFLNFPYPARDAYSGLNITHTGCQLVTGFQALAVARSRHFEYYRNGRWMGDGSSDYGRIARQDAFLRGMIERGKSQYNPANIISFLSIIPQGISIDSKFTPNFLVGLAVKFHSLNSANFQTYMLPVISAGNLRYYGDSLVVNQPAAQELLVKIFGNELTLPTMPPPNKNLVPTMPPVIPTTTTSTTTTTVPVTTPGGGSIPTTTLPTGNYFNPVPCSP